MARDDVFHSQVTAADPAVALTGYSDEASASVVVAADPDNAAGVYLGGEDVDETTGFLLPAGGSVSLDLRNVGRLYVFGTSPDKVYVLGLA